MFLSFAVRSADADSVYEFSSKTRSEILKSSDLVSQSQNKKPIEKHEDNANLKFWPSCESH